MEILIISKKDFFSDDLKFELSLNNSRTLYLCENFTTVLQNYNLLSKIDLVILDLFQEYYSGIEIIQYLRKHSQRYKIIVYSNLFQKDLLRYIKENNFMYLPQKTDVIIKLTEEVESGHFDFFEKNVLQIWEGFREGIICTRQRTRIPELDDIEVKIIRLIAEGYTAKEIGLSVFLSKKSIDNHTSAILRKLNLRNRIEIVRFAFCTGICHIPCLNIVVHECQNCRSSNK